MPKYSAVFFDWDGTLVDSLDVIVRAHNHVREAFGLEPWEMIDYFGTASQSAGDLYPKIYGAESGRAITLLYDYLGKNHLDYTKPLNGAEDLLKALKTKNIVMGVVSNKRHEVLNTEIDHMGWRPYFAAVVGAGHAKADKPDPAPLQLAIKEAGIAGDLSALLYVGDTETDLKVASGTGCDSALLLHGRTDMQPLIERYKPVYVTQDVPGFQKAFLSS